MNAEQIVELRNRLACSRRVVVKVGSQVLCRADGSLDDAVLVQLCRDLARCLDAGCEVVLVSSGAVASGRSAAAEYPQANQLGKQALAAIGQPLLMARYRQLFGAHGRLVAQLLLTHADLADRSRFLHARRVIAELMSGGVLAIVNENDTIAVEELRFGDNDALAAQVAHVVSADALLLLTEVDGLCTADPRLDPTAVRIQAVALDDAAERYVSVASTSSLGTGGMGSKLAAARRAGSVGCVAAIAKGKLPGVIGLLLSGADVGTIVEPAHKRLTGKRSWLATSVRTRGCLHLDAGAVAALTGAGRSLLPIGVTAITGEFSVGDAVQLLGPTGETIGKGLIRYDSADARRAQGKRSDWLADHCPWLPAEIVHRDDLALK